MKPIKTAILFLLITGISLAAKARTVYPINANVSSSSFGTTAICSNCLIVIASGVKLTINSTATCTNCTFEGGTIDIVSAANLTLNGTDSFKNETVLINNSFATQTALVFYGDSVAFNTPMNISNGVIDLDSDRISVNSALTLNEGTFNKDSLHLNANLSFTNAPDTIENSNVDLGAGVVLQSNNAVFNNNDFALSGTSTTGASISVINSASFTNTNYYLAGTSTVSSGSVSTLSGGSIVMTGTNNSFKVTNSLPVTNTTITMSGTNGTLSASSLTMSGGSLTADGATINVTNGLTFSGASVNLGGTTTLSAGSASLSSGSSLTMTGSSSIGITNGFSETSGTTELQGNSTIIANNVTLATNSFLQIGDGSVTSNGYVKATNNFSIDGTSNTSIGNNNNYLYTTNNSYKTNTISCGGAGQHACKTNYVYGCATLNSSAATQCTTLALANVDLTAAADGPAKVILSWTDNATATAAQYQVQRSADNITWSAIATVTANAYAAGAYQYADLNAPAGNILYRIVRTDVNGHALYTSVYAVEVTAAGNGVPIRIFPNPAVGGRFYLTTPGPEETIVNVYTTTGELLLHTALQGQTQYPVQLPSQPMTLTALVVQTIYRNSTSSFTMLVR